MVNRKLQRPVAPPPMGLPCGDCGLPGLGLHQVPVKIGQASSAHQGVPMLICRFCHRGVAVGRLWQISA